MTTARRLTRENLEGYLFVTPALTVLIVFLLAPAIWVFGLSLYHWDLIAQNPDYVGLANYDRLLNRDDTFRQALVQTVYYVVGTVPTGIALGLFVAVILNKHMPGRDAMRGAMFAPYVMPLVATVLIWAFMFNPDAGVLNAVLHFFHIPPVRWLGDPRAIMPAVILYSLWQHTGFNVVIFLSGLAGIPTEMQEAARVDGANSWQVFWRVTWPMLTPTTYFVLLISLIGSFKVVQQIIVFTGGGGGPDHAAETIGLYLYQKAFVSFQAGYAGAISVVLFLIILAITGLQMRLTASRVFYR